MTRTTWQFVADTTFRAYATLGLVGLAAFAILDGVTGAATLKRRNGLRDCTTW